MSPTDRASLLSQAEQLLRKDNFSREDASRTEQLIALADRASDKAALRRATLSRNNILLGREPLEAPEVEPDLQFRSFLMHGKKAIDSRALGVATDAGGNFIAPQSYAAAVEVAMKSVDQILEACSTFTTERGTPFTLPVLEDTTDSNIATIVNENAPSIGGPDAAFEAVAWGKCPQWRSGLIKISVEILQDSLFPVEQLLASMAGTRLARGIGKSLVTALLAGSTSGVSAAGPTSVTPDELLSLVGSIDPAYQIGAGWVMNPATYITILKLKASTAGSFMFESERDSNGRPLLFSWPIFLSPSMPSMTTGEKPIVFGDLSKLTRRIVSGSLTARVLTERYAEFGEVAVETLLRTDCALLKSASTTPVKYITLA